MFDYFYGAQSDQFSFYRVPKVMFTDPAFQNVSAEAKILYGLFLDRMGLSARNKWVDEQGRVYIIYTIDQIMKAIGCSDKKVNRMLRELEVVAGLIERKRQGLGKPNLIYVKNFLSVGQNGRFLNRKMDDSGVVETQFQESSKVRGSNTEINNTEYSDTDPFLSADRNEGMRERAQYESYFRESLYFDLLLQDHRFEEETLEGILDLLVDTCCSKRKTIRIAGDDKPAEVVKSRLKSQLKAIYKDNADTIIGNCDTQIFLGGSEPSTLKDLAEALGKETIDTFNTSDTRGNSPSYGTNYQKLGKELMSRDELAVLEGSKCILQLRGVRPFLSDKYDLTQHPNFKYTADSDKKLTFDIEKFLDTRAKLKASDEFLVVEA